MNNIKIMKTLRTASLSSDFTVLIEREECKFTYRFNE